MLNKKKVQWQLKCYEAHTRVHELYFMYLVNQINKTKHRLSYHNCPVNLRDKLTFIYIRQII